MFSTWYLWTLSLGVPVRQCITDALMFYSLLRVNRKTKPTQLDRKTPKRRSKVVNKIHHLSPILEQDFDEEQLLMQELEEERERQTRKVEEAVFLEEYQNQS